MKYWAFISYSHSDKKWGDWLHHALETCRIPGELIGKPARGDEIVPARVFPVFRDREELPTSADLGSVIQSALEQSRYLVVICSPRSAKSKWVNQEIIQYRRLGRDNRILALIVDGEPNAADKPGLSPDLECFPDAIRYQLGPDGQLDKTRPNEPIAADARADKDGKSNAVLKLIAGLVGVNYDDLKRRDEARRRRRQRVAGMVVGVLLLTFATLTGVALWQRRIAITQRREADVQRQTAVDQRHEADSQRHKAEEALIETRRALAEAMLTEARQRLEKGDRSAAAVLFAQANQLHPSPYAQANALALLRVLPRLAHMWPAAKPVGLPTFSPVHNPGSQFGSGISRIGVLEESWWMFDEPMPGDLIRQGSVMRSLALSADGTTLITAGQEGFARFWNTGTLKPATRPIDDRDGDARLNYVRLSLDGTRLLTADSEGRLRLWNARSGEAIGTIQYPGCRQVVFSADSKMLVAGSAESKDVRFWDTATCLPSHPAIQQPAGVLCLALSNDGKKLLVGLDNEKLALLWNLADTAAPQIRLKLDDDPYAVAIDLVHDRAAVVTEKMIELFALSKETPNRRLYVEHAPTEIGFDAAGDYLWSAGPGDQIAWWNAADGEPVARFGSGVGQLFWTAPDASSVISGNNETSLLTHWQMPEFSPPRFVPAPAKEQASRLSDDGKLLAVADGMTVNVYDSSAGARISQVVLRGGGPPFDIAFMGAPPTLKILHGIVGGIEVQSFDPIAAIPITSRRMMGNFTRVDNWSPNFSRISVAEKGQPVNAITLAATDSDAAPLRLTFPGEPANGIGESGGVINHTGQPVAWNFSADGSRLAVATADRIVRIYDARTGKNLRDLGVQDRHIQGIALSHTGDRVAFATSDLTIHIHNVSTGAAVRPAIRIVSDIADLSFTTDARWLIIREQGATLLLDLNTPITPPRRIPGQAVISGQSAVSESSDYNGEGITGYLLRRWDLQTGLEIGSAIHFGINDEPKLLRFSARAGRAILRQKDRLAIWSLDADPASLISPEDLLRRASAQTGIRIGEGNRAEPISPARWRALSQTP